MRGRYLPALFYHDYRKLLKDENFSVDLQGDARPGRARWPTGEGGQDAMTRKHRVRLGKYHMPLPGSAIARVAIGLLLILGGCLGFLPVLGFWMAPLGLVVLSIDLPFARRWRRRAEVWWGNCRESRRNKKRGRDKPGPKALGNGGVSSRKTRE